MPLRELDGRATVLGTYIAEELVTGLFSIGKLEIVERGLLDKVLGELKLGASGVIDPETAKQVGKLAGVEAIVTGTITDLQSLVALNCRLIDTQTGRIFAAASTKIIKDEDVKKIMGVSLPGTSSVVRDSAQETQVSDGPAGGTSGHPGTLGSGPVQKPVFESDSYRLIVESVRKVGNTVSVPITAQSTSTKTYRLTLYSCYLIDENGERWDFEEPRGQREDFRYTDLLPGTKRKGMYRFHTNGEPSGRVFTLSCKERGIGWGGPRGPNET